MMPKSKHNSSSALVYSTDPGFRQEVVNDGEAETLLPSQQKLFVRLDTKHRAGKAVTIIDGFIGKPADKDELGKKLKTFCGTGGSIKDGDIIVQGDNRDKIVHWLLKDGYTSAKKK